MKPKRPNSPGRGRGERGEHSEGGRPDRFGPQRGGNPPRRGPRPASPFSSRPSDPRDRSARPDRPQFRDDDRRERRPYRDQDSPPRPARPARPGSSERRPPRPSGPFDKFARENQGRQAPRDWSERPERFEKPERFSRGDRDDRRPPRDRWDRDERRGPPSDRPRSYERSDRPYNKPGRPSYGKPAYGKPAYGKRDFEGGRGRRDERPVYGAGRFEREAPREQRPHHVPGLFTLYGRMPVLEVLKLGLVKSVEITERAHGKAIEDIRALAVQQRVPVIKVEGFTDEEGLTVQGIRAFASPPELRQDLRHFLHELPATPAPIILMLDGVTDPQNFGAILRTAAAAGVNAVVVRERRQSPMTDVVVKASAGAAYFIPVFQVTNLNQVVRMLEEEGFWSVAASVHGESKPYTEYHWDTKTLLILGGEGGGVSDLIERTVTDRVAIPMAPGIESLNVSVAAGILLFEAIKQRQKI